MKVPGDSVLLRVFVLAAIWSCGSCNGVSDPHPDTPVQLYVDQHAIVVAPGNTVSLTVSGRRDSTELLGPLPEARFTNLSPSVLTVTEVGRVTARVVGIGLVEARLGDAADTVAIAVRAADHVPQTRWRSVDAGEITACAIDEDGRGYCWGNGFWGNLGEGSRRWWTGTHAPVPVSTSEILVEVSVGESHVCALTADAAALCWGDNNVGNLGVGYHSTPEPLPLRTELDDVLQVVASGNHSCAVNTSGRRYCWGSNIAGQLGLWDAGVETYRVRPTSGDESIRFTEITAGTEGMHTCGRTGDSTAYCWGYNDMGQTGVGVGAPGAILAPEPVAGGLQFDLLTAGGGRTCGIGADAITYCWGGPAHLILGRDTVPVVETPVPISSDLQFVRLSADQHICGITSTGSAYCWGYNEHGQLGSNQAADVCSSQEIPCSGTPLAVSGDLVFEQIDAGESITCGITTDKALYCWGSNEYGQLGGGTLIEGSHEPVRVADPVVWK